MKYCSALFLLFFCISVHAIASTEKVVKESIASGQQTRSNKNAWTFLKKVELANEQTYAPYGARAATDAQSRKDASAVNSKYLTLMAKGYAKNAEAYDIMKDLARAIESGESADAIKAKREESQKQLKKLQHEQDKLEREAIGITG